MHVKIIPKKETSQVELEVAVPNAKFQPFLKRAAAELSTHHPLPGFRPGQAPINIVASSLGEERLLKHAMDLALPHMFIRAIIKNKIDAIGRPSISVQELGMDKDLRFIATVSVMPIVTLADPTTLKVEKREVEVKDEDMDAELQYLAKMRSTFLEVPRPAEKGDTVLTDFRVEMDGVVMDGGESKNHPVHIGEGHFVPDFENNLIGIQAGEERKFEINFPVDFARKEYQGKKAQVVAKANVVQKRVIPELNDDFAKTVGKFETLQQLKDELKKNVVHEREHHEEERVLGELSEKLAEGSTFEAIPEVLLDKEIDNRVAELRDMLAYQQKTLESYMEEQKKSMEDIRKEMREPAEKAIKVAIALRAFADAEKITVSPAEVDKRVNDYMERYSATAQAQGKLDPEELRDNIASNLRNQLALKRLQEKAGIKPLEHNH